MVLLYVRDIKRVDYLPKMFILIVDMQLSVSINVQEEEVRM